jgi:hypothetical protein
VCFRGDDVTAIGQADGDWEYSCNNPFHADGTHSWIVSARGVTTYVTSREGYLDELGVSDDLLASIQPDDPWLEYGVVEHRFSEQSSSYARLVSEYGHSRMSSAHGGWIEPPLPGRIVSSRLAQGLGQLAREQLIAKTFQMSTGYWAYNGPTSYWAPPPAPPESRTLTWMEYATQQGLDPEEWVLPSFPTNSR